eukprot:825355-Rhodomonas_salina.1
MTSIIDNTNNFVPAHVQQWVCEMQEKASMQSSMKDAEPSAPASTARAVVCYNEIEAEVIQGGRRHVSLVSDSSSDDEDESHAFGRHMFVNKKAHR